MKAQREEQEAALGLTGLESAAALAMLVRRVVQWRTTHTTAVAAQGQLKWLEQSVQEQLAQANRLLTRWGLPACMDAAGLSAAVVELKEAVEHARQLAGNQ